MKVFTKLGYFKKANERLPFFHVFHNDIPRTSVGNLITVNLLYERLGFYLTTASKAGYAGVGNFVLSDESFDGLCIAVRKRSFGSSITVRLVDAGVLIERKIHLYSLYFHSISFIPRVKASHLFVMKAKLYYFTPRVLRKFLNVHYYS